MGYYNWFHPMPEAVEALDTFCALASGLCEYVIGHIVDPTVDNVPRFEAGMPSTPSGQTYRSFVYYA